MPARALIAPAPNLRPEQYRHFVQAQIVFYPRHLLACGDCVVFYSGPGRETYKNTGATGGNNNFRSKVLAFALGATRINDTRTAHFLEAQDLNTYFHPYAASLHKTKALINDKKNKAYAIVWGGPSELLAQMDFIHAATVVCGAEPDRVFMIDEIEPLLENKVCQTSNNISITAPKRMLWEVSKDDSFDLLCRSELKLVQTLALTDIINFSWWHKDFNERVNFYTHERKHAHQPALTGKQRRKKREIIEDFGLKALYDIHPRKWGHIIPSGASLKATAPILSLV